MDLKLSMGCKSRTQTLSNFNVRADAFHAKNEVRRQYISNFIYVRF